MSDSFRRTTPSGRGVTGIILVGGKSRRMGLDKTFLEVGAIPLFERVLGAFEACFDEILLIGDRPERFERYALPVIPDIYPGSALGGLYTGLSSASGSVFVSSCDLPYPDPRVIRHLCSLEEGHDAVVPLSPVGYEPMFALYSKRCLEPMKRMLERGDFCAYGYYPEIDVRFVQPDELSGIDPGGRCFINLNTPEDVEKLDVKPKYSSYKSQKVE